MKGPQIALLVWLGNLLLLGGGGVMAYSIYTEIKDGRDSIDKAHTSIALSVPRVNWLESAQRDAAQVQDFRSDRLSLRDRPKAVVRDTTPPPPPPPPAKDLTDEELKAELQKWLNEKFFVLRIWYGPPALSSAEVIAKEANNASLRITTNMNFPEHFKTIEGSAADKLRTLDMTCIAINPDSLMFRAPSVNKDPKYHKKYFEVPLVFAPGTIRPASDASKLGKRSPPPTGQRIETPKQPIPAPAEVQQDVRPKESTYDAETDTWTLGTNDFANVNTDELAKFAKVVYDRSGKPLGIQISDEIPENNTVITRGGRRGDIIKSINGQPVTSMADVRGIVRKQYNDGVTKFVVEFERDGVPGTKTIIAPQNKK